MQNVKFVVAKSYERIHRSNLVQFGVIPLEFKKGEDAKSLGLTGKETFSLTIDPKQTKPRGEVTVVVGGNPKIDHFSAILRFDTETEFTYFKHGGVLNYVIRQTLSS